MTTERSTSAQPLRLAVIDTDSGFLQVLDKRLERLGFAEAELAEPVRAGRRVEQVRGEHGVAAHAFELDTVTGEDDPVALVVLRDLGDGRVLEERVKLHEGPPLALMLSVRQTPPETLPT